MAQRSLIEQTGYDLIGGRCLVGGTGYDIIKGRTLVGGTGYDIPVGGATLEDFVSLISGSTIVTVTGRGSSSAGTVYSPFTNKQPGDYIFSFCNENFAINRWDGSALQLIYQSSASEGNVRYSGGNFYYSNDGASNTTVYAAALMCLRVPSTYTQEEADAILGSISLADSAGRKEGTTAKVSLPCASDSTLIAVCASTTIPSIGFYSPVNVTAILQNNSSLYYDGTTAWLSSSGTAAYNVRGCGIYKIEIA